ncbi:MAG: hypothetical protein VZR09_07970 [Candidatus Gastranaerophilaceae bacterium]|jgi:hypothetical protein|nr:hypothetical protein [Candidatus Gastranaerophilaceae bacterium]
MVDAVSAINGAINSTVQKNKDLSIDWKKLNANEILDYAGQGQDVPIDILKWAKDYAKLEDAPEDVTYDSVGGATTVREANEATAKQEDVPDTEEAKEKAEEQKIEDTEGTGGTETTESTGEEDTVEAEDEPSLYEQAGVLIPLSQNGTTSADMMSADTVQRAKESERSANQSEQKAESTESRVKSAKAEYDDLIKKIQNDKENVTPGDLLKLQQLSGNMQQTGLRAQSELAAFEIQLQEIEEIFSQYSDIVPEIEDTGKESVTVGNELVKQNPPDWPFIFSREYVRGKQAIKVGNEAISASEQANNRLDDGSSRNNDSISTNQEAEDKVEELTLVEEFDITSTEDKREQRKAERDKERNNNSAAIKIQLEGVKDTTIQADDLEIKRRKANRGEGAY